jgi:hypothetical protein
MNKVVSLMKILTGRQLPDQRMNAAMEGEEPEGDFCEMSSNGNTMDNLVRTQSGNFRRLEVKFEYMATPDASWGWSQPHLGYYATKKTFSEYDSDGRITRLRVYRGNIYTYVELSQDQEFVPPGSFFGRKIREASR